MRNMLALFGAALLTVVGAGWYLHWYKVSSQPASVPGQHTVNIDINTNKISKDIKQGEEKLQQFLEKRGGEEPSKIGEGLMLPSPGAAQNKGEDKGAASLFQYHSGKSSTQSNGTGTNHPLIQLGNK
jgi:hypothetical protein